MNLINLESDSLYCFDWEVYPNFASITIVSPHNAEDSRVFLICPWRDDRVELVAFIKETSNLVMIGFNSLGYDDLITNCVLDNLNAPIRFINNILYSLSGQIVNGRNRDLHPSVKKYKWFKQNWYKSLDLMTVRPGATFTSLKQIAIALKHHRVQDLPMPFDSAIDASQAEKLLDYNRNDVDITIKLFHYLLKKGEIQLRLEISKLYGVDVTNRDRSGIANALMNKFYAEATGQHYNDFKDIQTEREQIILADIIPDDIVFESPVLVELLKKLRGTTLTKTWNSFKKRYSFSFKDVLTFGGIHYQLGVGGLHSKDEPGIFETTEDSFIVDCDVTSFYPFIMLNGKVKPEHCDNRFYEILRMIVEERVKAKRNKEGIKADALKIVINSIFGKLGSDYSWMKDEQAMIQVTLSGQLYLLSLIDRFVRAGIKVISANTDGIVCDVKYSQKEEYEAICKQWEADTQFGLEFTYYDRFIRRDVNNYLTVTNTGKLKIKGCFESGVDLYKGFKHPIVAQALENYFLGGIDPSVTLQQCNSIYDFCISQKVSADFKTKFFSMTENGYEEVTLQKNNRFFVATVGGSAYKRKSDSSSKLSLIAGEVVQVANDVDESLPIDKYPIKYDWYEAECWKIIELIKPRNEQLSLFA